MNLEQLMGRVREILPDAQEGIDNYGQIIIYSGKWLDEEDNLVDADMD